MKWIVHTDGGSRGNPGPAAAGVVIQDPGAQGVVYEAGHFLGTMTNNAAEYRGLILALETAAKMGADELDIRSDSQLMVRQILGEYKVKSVDLMPLFQQARRLLGGFKNWSIRHVYRESNDRADALANLAMDGRKDVIVRQPEGWGPAAGAGGSVSRREAKSMATGRGSPTASGQNDLISQRGWWVVELETSPGAGCPAAGMTAGKSFEFGPGTPEGMCVYAAATVLGVCVNAMGGGQGLPERVVCTKCGAGIQVRRGDPLK